MFRGRPERRPGTVSTAPFSMTSPSRFNATITLLKCFSQRGGAPVFAIRSGYRGRKSLDRGTTEPSAARLGLYRCRRGERICAVTRRSSRRESRPSWPRRAAARQAHPAVHRRPRRSASTSASAPPPTTPTAAPTSSAGIANCATSELKGSLGPEEGAAGSTYAPLVLTNAGTRTCEVRGFPGVSYVAGADGHQVGPAAAMNGPRGGEVVLKPGARGGGPGADGERRQLRPRRVQADPGAGPSGLPAGRHRFAVRRARGHRLRGHPAGQPAERADPDARLTQGSPSAQLRCSLRKLRSAPDVRSASSAQLCSSAPLSTLSTRCAGRARRSRPGPARRGGPRRPRPGLPRRGRCRTGRAVNTAIVQPAGHGALVRGRQQALSSLEHQHRLAEQRV